jgi:hypothetical protein
LVQETQTGEINLPDDDPFAVRMMIQYLYHQTYTIPQVPSLAPEDQWFPMVTPMPSTAPCRSTRHSFSGDSSGINSFRAWPPQTAPAPPPQRPASGDSIIPYVNLRVHYKVYALGEKYGIHGLKALAVSRFESEGEDDFKVRGGNGIGDFIQVMKEAYTSTAEGDRPLRDAVVRMLKPKTSLFEREDVKEFLKEEDLAYDLVMSYVRDNSVRGRTSLEDAAYGRGVY